VRAEKVAQWTGPAQTKDGHAIQVLANVADGNAARLAAQSQAEGIGLYRTELSFLSANSEPSVDEQAKIYGKVFDAFPDSKVLVLYTIVFRSNIVYLFPLLYLSIPSLLVSGLILLLDQN